MNHVPEPNAAPRSSVVLLHGFTQTGACFGPLADALGADHGVIRPDLPGHGAAAGLATLDLDGIASHLAAAIGPTLDAPAVWIGYSLGGRVALHVALSHPEVVSGLVLIGATAGIADDEERAARAARDDELAQQILSSGVGAFLRQWLQGPMFADLPEWARFESERRRNTADGLAASLRHAGTGSMVPLWDRLHAIEVPVLCITGAHDEKFTALGRHLVERLPSGRLEVVEAAGHAVHLERADAVAASVLPFCAESIPRGPARRNDPAPRWYESS